MQDIMENEFLIKFGLHLRKLREEKNLSIRELELRGDIDRHMLSRIENGKSNPTLLTIKKICDALEIKLEDLFNKI